ncbi:hypothetical protein AKJ09_03227 [Labilithrix luteola]|uniref:HMA domain-containing protein n=2 Tax=Labilithrix luteola TaxID=1391654 RepID=A0A0K1PSQ0_9BACT|nr:hypothetical protein AKJ09_03227 [Labilithrix luteola]
MHHPQDVLKIAHYHPGRLRVRAKTFANASDSAERVKDEVAHMRGVRSVRHDRRTGSVLVEYEPRFAEANRILERIATVGELAVEQTEARKGSDAADSILELFRWLDEVTEQASGSRLNLRLLVPGGIAAFGVYSLFKSGHPPIPRWDNLAYWAYSMFVELNARREVPRP